MPQQALADVEARMGLFLQHHNMTLGLGQESGGRGARRATANHEDVRTAKVCLRAHYRSILHQFLAALNRPRVPDRWPSTPASSPPQDASRNT